MPPLINTIRFETIYAPTIPQLILVKTAASKAFWKKVYPKSSKKEFILVIVFF